MKHRIYSLLAAAILVLALTFPVATPATPAAHPAAKAATPAPPDHPEIRDALDSLRRAKEHLQHARHDFGGHRVDAIHAIDGAMRQLEICMQYDKD